MAGETFSNIHPSGGLLSSEFIRSARAETSSNPFFSPETFSKPDGTVRSKKDFEAHVAQAWSDFCERFDEIRLSLRKWNAEEARRKWTLPILDRILDLDPKLTPSSDRKAGEAKARPKVSHRGWSDASAPPVNIVPPSQPLDEKSGTEKKSKSPHDALQSVLNASGKASWGIVTNGLSLRVLRTYYHTYTHGYIEFDLEGIFAERSYSDFRALLRLAHASRFHSIAGGKPALETFYEQSVAAGIKVGEDLRKNVKGAIEALGNGLLTPSLASDLNDSSRCKEFYEEVLRVVYRILFLLYAEQRAMLPTRDSVYAEEYSLTRLRQRSERALWNRDEHNDLWTGLLTTFQLLKEGCPEIGVYPYNGPLFDNDLLPTVAALSITNKALLEAIRAMTLIERDGVLQHISYLDIGVEEIGSVYESLLDFTPRVLAQDEMVDGVVRRAGSFVLDPLGGSRKTTGSYYTNPELVSALVESALVPVVEGVLKEAGDTAKARESAILSLRVCDPACGSGAFLIAGAHYLGKILAEVRTGNDYPGPKELERARRDVLQHCIYAVDLNPMAVELAKVSLWIDSATDQIPLNFLDHHIKAGNSLIGMTLSIADKPVPPEAFAPIFSDDKVLARQVQKQASQDLKQTTWDEHPEEARSKEAIAYSNLSELEELTVGEVESKRRAYHQLSQSPDWQLEKLAANAWTAAFFWPLDASAPPPPTQSLMRRLRAPTAQNDADASTFASVEKLAEDHNFFHWQLEFPDVFWRKEAGFDCVLGNPPWERVKIQEKEFFEIRDPTILRAETTAKRRQLIAELKVSNPVLWREFAAARQRSESTSKFIRSSGRFPLTGRGDINTYSVFAEHITNIVAQRGRAGFIVPTGIATDDTNKDFFGNLVEQDKVVSVIDFENKEKLFPSVHSSYKFSLTTIGHREQGTPAQFAFFLTSSTQLAERDRFFPLGKDDFELLNPNTRTCPLFRTRRDADITKSIYHRVPVLVNHRSGWNPWGIKFLTMFHMSNDSALFQSREEMEKRGFHLHSNAFVKGSERYLPLYEAKMIWQFDHRYGSFDGKEDSSSSLPNTPLASYQNPDYVVLPRYWVSEKDTLASMPDQSEEREGGNSNAHDGRSVARNKSKWFIGFRNIARATDERTFIAAIVPLAAVGHNLSLVLSTKTASEQACLLANIETVIHDYCVRQKAGGVNMSFFLVEQFPILPPTAYSSELRELVSSKVLELVYTSRDLSLFAADMGYVNPDKTPRPPFPWDVERRFQLRCEIDAVYFHLYGLTRSDVEYVMETFPITKRHDLERYGTYRTKETILAEYDRYQGKIIPYNMAGDERLKYSVTPPNGRKEEGVT